MRRALLIGMCLLGGCMPSCESEREKQERHRQSIVTVKLYDDFLRGLRAAVPGVEGLEERPCPDEAIGQRVRPLGDDEACSVDGEFLDRYAGGGEAVDDSWIWLRHSAFDGIAPPAKIDSPGRAGRMATGYLQIKVSCPYLAVLRAPGRRLPEPGRGDAFDKGVFDGWVVIVDRDALRPVCQARVRAESSDHPPIDKYFGTGRESREWDLRKDLHDQVEHAAREALARITKKLRLRLAVFF